MMSGRNQPTVANPRHGSNIEKDHLMFESLKTALRRLIRSLEKAADRLTCHHALYAYLALAYGLGCAGVIGKDLVAELATAIYFTLSMRG